MGQKRNPRQQDLMEVVLVIAGIVLAMLIISTYLLEPVSKNQVYQIIEE